MSTVFIIEEYKEAGKWEGIVPWVLYGFECLDIITDMFYFELVLA